MLLLVIHLNKYYAFIVLQKCIFYLTKKFNKKNYLSLYFSFKCRNPQLGRPANECVGEGVGSYVCICVESPLQSSFLLNFYWINIYFSTKVSTMRKTTIVYQPTISFFTSGMDIIFVFTIKSFEPIKSKNICNQKTNIFLNK